MPKISLFILMKTLENAHQNLFTVGQMRKALSIMKKIENDIDMVSFVAELLAIKADVEKEKFVTAKGYDTVNIETTEDEHNFLKDAFAKILVQTFPPNLDKRVIVSIADALGVE